MERLSTLLTHVGSAKRPLCLMKGGFMRGRPALPSMERMRAVPSPQT